MSTSVAMQQFLPGHCPVENAIEKLASASDDGQRGAVFTRGEVVEFILDLTGFLRTAPLVDCRLLEPSFGNGAFLLPAVKRLLAAAADAGKLHCEALEPAVRAVELHRATFERTRILLIETLGQHDICRNDAVRLSDAWLIQGDFLLSDLPSGFTHVIGNPPYVRHDNVPPVLMKEYRRRFSTIFDRADLYVPFIERSLSFLSDGGKCGFICADRWMKNKYGRKLREFVRQGYNLKIYVDMAGSESFDSDVSAYPAITVIERGLPTRTRTCERPTVETGKLKELAQELTSRRLSSNSVVREIGGVASRDAPWVLSSGEEAELAERLEASFPSLEQAGCKVGIGVATGADKAFIGNHDEMNVEESRKLPLVMTRDIQSGHVEWLGMGVINPFDDAGKLVDLEQFPLLNEYLLARRDLISSRHVAVRQPENWYRTIDRIHPELTARPKLLVPDIKGDASVVHERGRFYPHHNLYFITSDEWDVHALRRVMLSGVAKFFVALYSPQMRGGYLRFQAQYLRRIRIPRWSDVSANARNVLSGNRDEIMTDRRALAEIISEIYGLSRAEARLFERHVVK